MFLCHIGSLDFFNIFAKINCGTIKMIRFVQQNFAVVQNSDMAVSSE